MLSETDRVRLQHMLDAAREAVFFAGRTTLVELQQDRQLQLALARLIEIVGEAGNRVSPAARQRLPGLPWPDIVGMRNRLVHAYFNVDLRVLHATAIDDLPPLIAALAAVLEADAGQAEGETNAR